MLTEPGVHVPAVAVVKPAVPLVVFGSVQPAGTTIVTNEFAAKFPLAGAVNVNVSVFPDEPAVNEVGETVIVPSPLFAAPGLTVRVKFPALLVPNALVAVTVNGKVPVVDVVPDKTPVLVLNVTPAGSAPVSV